MNKVVRSGKSSARPSAASSKAAVSSVSERSPAPSPLTGLEHLDHEFATTWPTFDLDPKTLALLGHRKKLTETPGAIEEADFDALRAVGWDERGIYQATALISFYNFSGQMEAASGLPMDGPQLGDQLVRMHGL